MKKNYIAPDLEVVAYRMRDILVVSPTEETIPEIIGGGDSSVPDLDGGL